MRHLTALSILALVGTSFALAAYCPPANTSQTLVAHTTPAQTRSPALLQSLLAAYDQAPSEALKDQINAAAAQYDATWSRLYWHTDLASAQAQARAERKPILYLRLMGKLTDEYSCANSRFFRTVLYANPDVASTLRDNFVLVWESERPVPVLTVDYGDGRVLKRTITGNSAHYVLNADGHVVDIIPGLMDPVAFTRILSAAMLPAAKGTEQARTAHLSATRLQLALECDAERQRTSIEHRAAATDLALAAPIDPAPHAAQAMPLGRSKGGIERPLVKVVAPENAAAQPVAPNDPAPHAANALPLALSKTGVERRLVKAVAPEPAVPPAADRALPITHGKRMVEAPTVEAFNPKKTETSAARLAMGSDLDDATLNAIAALHAAEARLHPQSLALMREQNPRLAADPAAFARTQAQFESLLAKDSALNQFNLRRRALSWLAESPAALNVETFNTRVYAELFLTPRSDPWIGLVPADTYSALTCDGINTPAAPAPRAASANH